MNNFTIYPAIDLRGGRVVRLLRGDPNRQTVFGDDASEVARQWINAGANWLHVVNLDGAFDEADETNQTALIGILSACKEADPPVRIQFGGGLRSLADIERVLGLGASRVVLGTLAVKEPSSIEQALDLYGIMAVAVAIDVDEALVKVQGWTRHGDVNTLTLARRMSDIGVRTLIHTNIARDGVGSGVDVEMARWIAENTDAEVVASGGVSSLADVRNVRLAGLAGVIIGRALYDGVFSLQEALKC